MNITHTVSKLRKSFSQDQQQARRNPWFLAWMGLVGLFLLVNVIFAVFAVSSNPGLVVEDYYEKGRDYEENAIKYHTASQSLGWTARLEIPDAIRLSSEDTFRFSAVDARGLPLTGAQVSLHAYRPSDANADFQAELQPIADGLYQTRLAFSLPGHWELTVVATRDAKEFHRTRRIDVLP